MAKHYRVTIGDVLQAHEEALLVGGLPGIRSTALLESAVGRPYSGYYRSIYRKAAALLESIAKNHAFVDGNKRTAFLAVDLLIRQSDYRYRWHIDDVETGLEDLILGVVEDEITFEESVAVFKQMIYPRRFL